MTTSLSNLTSRYGGWSRGESQTDRERRERAFLQYQLLLLRGESTSVPFWRSLLICPQLSQHRFFSRRGNDDCTNSNVSVKKGIYPKGIRVHVTYPHILFQHLLFRKAKGATVLRIFTCLNSRLCFYSSANHTCCHLMREVRHKMAILYDLCAHYVKFLKTIHVRVCAYTTLVQKGG